MIIITAKAHPVLQETLEKKGYEVVYAPAITYDELTVLIGKVEGLVVTTRIKIDAPLLEKATSLKWIGRLGSGMELINVEFATAKKIKCVSSPEGNRNAVAEHALGMLLSLMHKISRGNIEIKAGEWLREENRGVELSGKVVGVLGFGNTGEAFSNLLSVFGVTVLAFDKYKFGFGKNFIKEASFEQLCKYADVISFHLPLTQETRYMANSEFFDSLANKPYLLNTSRGGIINTASLINALITGKISGAALDVLENENIQSLSAEENSQLAFLNSHPDVIITPHIAGYTHEAFYKLSVVLLEKLDL